MLKAKSAVFVALFPLLLVGCDPDATSIGDQYENHDSGLVALNERLNEGFPPGWEDIGVIVDPGLAGLDHFDPDHPFGREPVMTEDFDEFGTCYSETTSDQADFFNSGTPCIDGMVALISGRGCPEVVYEDNVDGTHSVYCTTEPTCDTVHSDGYLAVPTNLNWNDFGSRSQMICQDNNVTLLYFSNKSDAID